MIVSYLELFFNNLIGRGNLTCLIQCFVFFCFKFIKD